MQYFKGDSTELKIDAVFEPLLSALSLQKDEFLENAYSCGPLGDLLYSEELAPLANAINQDIFRYSFGEIVDAFIVGGSFESYLTVFRKVFGDEVDVTFAVPAAGKLEIDIVADEVELSTFVARLIEENQYVYDEMITQDGDDTLVFQTIKGFQSQYELEQMLYEMVPAGVYTVISLTIEGD